VKRLRVPTGQTGEIAPLSVQEQLNERQKKMTALLVKGEELTSQKCKKIFHATRQAVQKDFKKTGRCWHCTADRSRPINTLCSKDTSTEHALIVNKSIVNVFFRIVNPAFKTTFLQSVQSHSIVRENRWRPPDQRTLRLTVLLRPRAFVLSGIFIYCIAG
jgi:hypothetical protein